MNSKKHKKKLKLRKKALEKAATPPLNNLPGLLPSVAQNQGQPSFREAINNRRLLQSQQQLLGLINIIEYVIRMYRSRMR